MIGKTIDELQAGDVAEMSHRVSAEDVAGFVEAVGDYNPIHSDAAYAATTSFKEPIAPGVYTAGLISAVIGTQLPGPGAIYLSQSLKFTQPVKFGDTITARVTVAEVIRERNRIRLLTVCENQRGEAVLSGEAWVMPSRTSTVYERRAPEPAALALALQPWEWAARAVALWATFGLSMFTAATHRGPSVRPTSTGRR
jgi:3-hydroxybutyryl-CoA dehydratase